MMRKHWTVKLWTVKQTNKQLPSRDRGEACSKMPAHTPGSSEIACGVSSSPQSCQELAPSAHAAATQAWPSSRSQHLAAVSHCWRVHVS